ncbi:YeeE/YedE family protein [Flavobacteriaceae bacterium]|nr:YeeE/YedE family protein [Flavobacteriaceae bacterium]MDA8947745.1 YeeE/YedE family protein [Flavobacteriaceae bacterium]MDA9015422.1 YeeE/YedE family protein [Flavobacteriaceae bacterium]MDB3863109.1 YeeE/YedE family protein [Flavobacteriaceae bacterium]MDC3354047.1 YeeE/YedE family protein [Flavobacteriaceae bacterium]
MEWIFNPWPWYIGGPMIALIMFLLLYFGKSFGMSSNLRTLCTICGAGKSTEFFNFDWKKQQWNLLVSVGAIIGGAIAVQFLTVDASVIIHPDTVAKLQDLSIQSAGTAYMPEELFSLQALTQPKVLLVLSLGGFLVGFGARYAGGCTSGHAISGLSNLQLVSLYAVIGFFVGGLFMNHLLLPYIL